MECRNALAKAEGDREKAIAILKEQSLFKVEKKKDRLTSEGLIEAYIHGGGRIGAMVEVNCETDFAAHTSQLKELAHHLAMQVAAMAPRYISPEEMPEGAEEEAKAACLLLQADIKNPEITIQDAVNEAIAKVGENIKISRFARFALNEL